MEHDTNQGNKQSKNLSWQNDFNNILSDAFCVLVNDLKSWQSSVHSRGIRTFKIHLLQMEYFVDQNSIQLCKHRLFLWEFNLAWSMKYAQFDVSTSVDGTLICKYYSIINSILISNTILVCASTKFANIESWVLGNLSPRWDWCKF